MNTRPTPETDAAWACFKGYMEPLQDVQDLSRKLERERDEAREQGNDMREKWLAKGQCCEYLGAELHEAIKQRDRLAKACDQYSEDEILCKLQTVTEQRDMLAEALQMITTFDYTDMQCDNGHGCRSVAQKALQSLTPSP